MKLTEKELKNFPIGTKLSGEAYSYIKLLHDIWAKDYPPDGKYYETAELVGDYKIEKIEIPTYIEYIPTKPILDDKEKEYLNNLIKPFKNEIKHIGKCADSYRGEYIYFGCISNYNSFNLPFFKAGTMYKGMELDKSYTIEELGL